MTTKFQVNAVGLRIFVTVHINGYPVRLQLDTAADITIISEELWKSIGSPSVQPTNRVATSASGGDLRLTGLLHCCVSFNGNTIQGSRYLSRSNLNLLGLDWLEKLGMIDLPICSICNRVHATMEPVIPPCELIECFSSIFRDGLGRCTQTQAVLLPKEGSIPTFRPKRPVPYSTVQLIDDELQRLESLGVLKPVTYSAWAAPIVVVKKPNGTLRICGDFSTGLNAVLQSNCYPLPVPEDLFTMLNGGTCFAKLDLAEAYLQVEIAPESREFVTIITHRGLYQYIRLPFCIETAPTIFQQIMDTMLAGIKGAAAYLDDIIIVGQSPEELRERTQAVLQRVEEYGFVLRSDKCQLLFHTIKFLGFIFDVEGRHPDPDNIRAIQHMPPPQDVTTLRSFLGMVSYYSAFLPELHNVRAPPNQLLEKGTPWCVSG
ncbi:reverse transcriptase domain-containing protein, partial [Streptococcus dysgalactiae]|uniref:reverse transcriptase domain-containing protein n=1 Tax=Streptococcus dysgalactiae TaxID=1334 RepID=UPI0019504D9F